MSARKKYVSPNAYWMHVPGFFKWFRRVVPRYGNIEISRMVSQRFPEARRLSSAGVRGLKQQLQLKMDPFARQRIHQQGTNRYWVDIPGFKDWMLANAPHTPGPEMLAAARERFPEAKNLTPHALKTLKETWGIRMTPEARHRALVKGAANNVGPATPEQLTNDELRAVNRDLMRRLEAAKRRKDELVKAVYDAAKEAATSLNLAPVRPLVLKKTPGTPETAIVIFGDWQLAKVTATYSSEICKQRIARYVDKVIRLTDLQRADHPVDYLKIFLVGDLLEGEQIFPGQSHQIDASLFRQVLVNGPDILGDATRRLSSHFKNTDIDGVIGNHGAIGGRRRGAEFHPETNADAMMYEATRIALGSSAPGVTWAPNLIPGQRKWYAVNYVGKKGFLLFHGDQIKGGMLGFPWYGFGKKILGWHAGAIHEHFDYAISGHFHTPVRGLYGPIRHWGSGSTESDNTFAAENLAAMGTPSQWLLFCHPEFGVTAEYEVHLERGAYEDQR